MPPNPLIKLTKLKNSLVICWLSKISDLACKPMLITSLRVVLCLVFKTKHMQYYISQHNII